MNKTTLNKTLFALSLGFAGLIMATQAGFAQPQCGDREAIVGSLNVKYGETRRSIGLAANNAVVEVYSSDKTGSWSILATTPAGLTCLIASGEAFQQVAEKTVAQGDPA